MGAMGGMGGMGGIGGMGGMGGLGLGPRAGGMRPGRPSPLMLARMDVTGGMGMGGLAMMPGMGMAVMPGLGMGLRQPPEVLAAHAKGLADIAAKKEELKKKQLQAEVEKVEEIHKKALAVLDAAMPKLKGDKK